MALVPMAYVLFAWTVGWCASTVAARLMNARLPPSRSLWEGVRRLYWIYEDDIDRRLIERNSRAHMVGFAVMALIVVVTFPFYRQLLRS